MTRLRNDDIRAAVRNLACLDAADEIDVLTFFKSGNVSFHQRIALSPPPDVLIDRFHTRILDAIHVFSVDGAHLCKLYQMDGLASTLRQSISRYALSVGINGAMADVQRPLWIPYDDHRSADQNRVESFAEQNASASTPAGTIFILTNVMIEPSSK